MTESSTAHKADATSSATSGATNGATHSIKSGASKGITESTSTDADVAHNSAHHRGWADKARAVPKNAIALLQADQEAVRQMFDEYQHTRSIANKKALLGEICTSLTVHMQVEEEVFYPDVRATLADKLLVREAMIEHRGVKHLIGQLQHAEAGSDLVDAKVRVMSEYVKRHVKREQNEMFPKVLATSLDIVELGARMAARRDDLMSRVT